jgi:hypothetical protein
MRPAATRVLLAVACLAASAWGVTSLWPNAAAVADAPVRAKAGAFETAGNIDGTQLNLTGADGLPFTVRIDSALPDAKDPDGEIVLYGLSYRDTSDRAWRPLCQLDAEGRSAGFPITQPGQAGFTIACTSDARGKCARLGYKPWGTAASGQSLAPYFESCVRMIRADYCGNGASHTRAGVPIKVWDRIGVRPASAPPPAEAAWGPGGAQCLARVRAPDVASLASVVAECPALAGRVHDACDSGLAHETGEPLLWSTSAPG